MPYTNTGIYYQELGGSPKISRDRNTMTASQTLMIPWASFPQFMEESFPSPYILGGFLIRPSRRSMPILPWLLTVSVDVEPWDSEVPGGCIDYASASWARVNVKYSSFQNEDENETDPELFLTQRVSVGAEYLTLAKQSVKWHGEDGGDAQADAKAEDFPFGQLVPTAEHQLTWKNVINPPWTAIRSTIGKANSTTFFDAEPETMLFLGAEMQREYTVEDAKPWQLDYRFSERLVKSSAQPAITIGWNHFFRPETTKWEVAKVNGGKIYPTAEFDDLFQPE